MWPLFQVTFDSANINSPTNVFQIFVIDSLCSNLEGIDPEKPYRATFESKVGENRTRHVNI